MTHPSPKRNMVPKVVLMRSGLVSLTTARPVNTAQPRTTVNSARPMTNIFNKAHLTVRRHINNKTATKNSNFNQKVNIVKSKNVNTARPKAVVNAARPKEVVNVVQGNHVNAVKASAYWGNPQMDLQDQGVIDSGCSRHMTGNMSYLTDFEEIDGGYVAFGGNPKGGKITCRGTKACDDAEGGDSSKDVESNDQEKNDNVNSTNNVNATSTNEVNVIGAKTSIKLPDDPNMPELEDIIYSADDDVGAEADMNNLNTFMTMDVKSDFLYGKIKEEVYVCQPPGFEDPNFPNRVYKVEKALYGLHQAPRACQDKYVTEILKKFGFTNVKTASTPMETQKPLLKDEDGEEVDVHLYRLIISSLIYLRGQPKLGLWYPKDSPFDLVAYTNSDYAGASLDRKSTTGGCQFLGCRLISWQCKKQTVVANSTTEAEYVAASSCCGQVLWIQNQLLDYGDSNEKKLIKITKIHTDKNVADLLTKAFDLIRMELELMLGKVNAASINLTAVAMGQVNAARQ
ncbi:putative ribonuclease H-like domain-containing protein [Tanacetum coccineum]